MDLQELLNKLNDEQKSAALDIHGPSMVVAGPGSGKTFTLVVRTANMIANGIPADKIILFTFTKKAALEIKERVIATIGDQANSITVGTYHGVCSKILRRYANYVGLTKSFSILDTDDCKKIAKDIIKTSGYNVEADKLLWKISDYKCKLMTPTDAIQNATTIIESQAAELYRLYAAKLLAQNCVDFDDLIFKTVHLLHYYPDVKEELNKQYQYIVAEFIGPYYGDVVCVPL